jgi:hypothetical protein
MAGAQPILLGTGLAPVHFGQLLAQGLTGRGWTHNPGDRRQQATAGNNLTRTTTEAGNPVYYLKRARADIFRIEIYDHAMLGEQLLREVSEAVGEQVLSLTAVMNGDGFPLSTVLLPGDVVCEVFHILQPTYIKTSGPGGAGQAND